MRHHRHRPLGSLSRLRCPSWRTADAPVSTRLHRLLAASDLSRRLSGERSTCLRIADLISFAQKKAQKKEPCTFRRKDGNDRLTGNCSRVGYSRLPDGLAVLLICPRTPESRTSPAICLKKVWPFFLLWELKRVDRLVLTRPRLDHPPRSRIIDIARRGSTLLFDRIGSPRGPGKFSGFRPEPDAVAVTRSLLKR